MNKSVKRFGCIALSLVLALPVFAGCKKKKTEEGEKLYDTESRAVVFATDALDGNFNPFFATSASDSKVAAMTQVGMLTTDAEGNPKAGDDVPTVVKAFKQTMKTSSGAETDDGSKAATTEYEFIIKNGMKFSDGVDLTIKDVLFNLYVYLDPMYMGSATIYSTNIQGLQAYRTQDPTAQDGTQSSDAMFYGNASQRISDMLEYLDGEDGAVLTSQISADIAKAKELFREEVESDWTACAGSQESYKDEYNFTEDWEIYYFNEGIVTYQYVQSKPQKGADGKYLTTLDPLPGKTEPDNDYRKDIEAVKASAGANAEQAVKEFAIQTVYDSYTAINSSLAEVIRYWATGSNLREEIAAEEKSAYFDKMQSGTGMKVESISGIQTSTTTTDFDGNDLGASHDVLKVVINKVDPKAIWNFAFSVAPMHYYSNDDAIANTKFGVKFANKEFFDTVLQDPAKNGLPVGGGVYKATNKDGSGTVNKDNFYENNWVYFERNTYFESMGGDTITNAKIKYLRYKVVGSDKIVQALSAGDIDFGEPQATVSNINEVGKYDFLNSKNYTTNGYGYVGINPKFVPDIEVRRAIMKAMNTASIVENYYTEDLAQTIYRPMSTLSWAYPVGCSEYKDIAFTTDKQQIKSLVESAGWKLGGDNIYEKNGQKLKITFTIAGETTDHPAYAMFNTAKDFLNSCGFDISVTTDITALKKLATGGLAVWAAAWSSTVDPDLYQVYHKDSKATSIKNWGYETIFADAKQFEDEQKTINDLSDKIMEARETLNQTTRTRLYGEALDLIMDLAVELPTYQRKDLVVYNNKVINEQTLNQNPSANEGVYDRLWEVDYN